MLQILLPCNGMKGRSFLLRCAAFFLMLIFFQKAGAGLFYHNLFHSSSANEFPSNSDKNIGYSCICIDDYLLPFEGTEQVSVSVPIVNFTITIAIFKDRLPFCDIVYSSLRGPPAVING
jgi:hypothetical protein